LHYRQLEHLYHHAIDALPPRRRDVFRLSRLEGLSHQQIASRLGISVRTVENHLAAAMQSIREFFSRQDMGPASMLLFFFWID
jgi:RNA polymerase sigma-70 factor (ECF subfamily)